MTFSIFFHVLLLLAFLGTTVAWAALGIWVDRRPKPFCESVLMDAIGMVAFTLWMLCFIGLVLLIGGSALGLIGRIVTA